MTRTFVVIGTRPEAIKLAPVIHALRQNLIDVIVCATGQHGELANHALRDFGLSPDIFLEKPPAGLDAMTGFLLISIGQALDDTQPELVMVQGDTASALAGAMAAHHRRIPVAHVEAGLRSGDLDQPWPEEGNRRLISALAAQHFAPTEHAARSLRAEGVCESKIFVTGNTGIDALSQMQERIAQGEPIGCSSRALLDQVDGRHLILVTSHRRETTFEERERIASAILWLAQRDDVFVLILLHPNPETRRAFLDLLSTWPNVHLSESVDYADLVRLLLAARLVLTDSGGMQEEASTLGVPTLVLRRRTERSEALIAGTALLVGSDSDLIRAQAAALLDDPKHHAQMARPHHLFGDGLASHRIARAIVEATGADRATLATIRG